MKFIEKIADYVLGNISRTQFPKIALCALEENIESESTIILAGMTEKDNTFVLEQYFIKALSELKIQLPGKFLSAKILIRYYLNEMIDNRSGAYKFMQKIDNDIYKKIDWEIELGLGKMDYVGKELGLEFMYTWYRELQDYKDGSMLLYYNELSKENQLEKFEQHLLEEAILLRDKLGLELTAHNTLQ
jgi:hypothetical protein